MACVLLLLATSAVAADALRVRVQRPLADDPLIDEAVIRVIGELGALGFEVEVLKRRTELEQLNTPPSLDPGTEGALIFAREGTVVLVSAWASNGRQAFIERFDASDENVTPQVIAVRSVEALRGMLLEPAPRSNGENDAVTQPPARTDVPIVQAAPELPPTRQDSPPVSNSERGDPFSLLMLVGPGAGLESAGFETVGLGGSLAFGKRGLFAGVGFDSLLAAGEIKDAAGSATIGRQRLLALLRFQLSLSPSVDGFLQLGGGAARYAVTAEAAEGFTATSRDNTDVVAQASVGTTYWPHALLGFFIAAEATTLLQPIHVQMGDRTVGSLGAPSGSLSFGFAARYP